MRRPLATLAAAALLLPLAVQAAPEASSEKRESRTTFGSAPHALTAALDGDPATAWMVDPEQSNEGSWIQLDVPRGKVDQVQLLVGWNKDEESWEDHARLKAGRLEVFTVDGTDKTLVHEQTFEVTDSKEMQTVDLPSPQVGGELSGGIIRLTVTEVFPGKDFQHLALGEFLVLLEEFDAAAITPESASSEAEGHPLAEATDGSSRTYWAAGADDEAPMLTVDPGRYSASSVGLTVGVRGHARPKTIKLGQGGQERTYEVPNKSGTHWFLVPPVMGYNGSGFGSLEITVVDTWPDSGDGPVAISEIALKATALSAF